MQFTRPTATLIKLIACFVLLTLALTELNNRKIGAPTSPPLVCLVVRTYWAHGSSGDSSLFKLLKSFRQSSHKRWQALLIVKDSKPFLDLQPTLELWGDERVGIFTQLVGVEHDSKVPHYHTALYNVTDDAIRACPPTTQWLVVTNGDNDYDQDFLPRLVSVPPEVDLVAFNYYSRYQRPTALPCERFMSGPHYPLCKENVLSFCNTDLAANVYKWKRFVSEDRRFAKMESLGDLGCNDGFMAEALVTSRWKVHAVHDRCLVDHSPSPQRCALEGGVWDDVEFGSFDGKGGRCLTDAEMVQRVLARNVSSKDVSHSCAAKAASQGLTVKMVSLPVSGDGKSFGAHAHNPLMLQCLHVVGVPHYQFFPKACASQIDEPYYPSAHPSASNMQDAEL